MLFGKDLMVDHHWIFFFNATPLDDFNLVPDNAIALTDMPGVQAKPDIAIKGGLFQVVFANSLDLNLYYLQVGEANGLSAADSENYRLYPNPAIDQVRFESPGRSGNLQIWTLSGKLLFQSKVDEQIDIPVREWEKGIYLLSFIQENQTYTTKLVVQ